MQETVTGRSLRLCIRGWSDESEYVVTDDHLGRVATLTLGIDFSACESDERHVVAQALRAIADDIDGLGDLITMLQDAIVEFRKSGPASVRRRGSDYAEVQ